MLIFAMVYNRSATLPVWRGKGRLVWLFFFTCLFLSLPTAGRLFAQGASQRLQISCRDRILDISARNVDIKDFFAALSEKANITIEYPASLEKRITLDRENISLKQFLSNFLRNMNHVIIYSGSDTENDRISEVLIYPKSTVSRSSVSTRSSSSARSQDRIRRQIDSYKRIVEKLRGTLSSMEEDNSRRQVYLNRIQRYEEKIGNLEKQLY